MRARDSLLLAPRREWLVKLSAPCDKLARLRGPGENYSDVILRLV
jgi:hypothetical protein